MDSARRELSIGRDSAAIEILQDWTEEHMPTPEEEDLLDSLQSLLPRPAGLRAHPWRVGSDVVVRPDRRMPFLGLVDVSRQVAALPGSGAWLFGGLMGGTWMDGNRLGAGIDARAELLVGDSLDSRKVAVWAGWTDADEMELGLSNDWRFSRGWGSWSLVHGPSLVASWRRTRLLGWTAELTGPRWRLRGALHWRQDPEWPEAQDGAGKSMELARAGFQSTTRMECQWGGGGFSWGPVLDLDGRILILPDRWLPDSVSGRSSSRRRGMECNTAGQVKWKPVGNFLLHSELGWAWTLQEGGAPLDLSPFLDGPYLRISSAWRI